MSDIDDDEHDKILNTPIIEGKTLSKAVSDLDKAIDDGDLHHPNEALAKMAAILRKMLENLAHLYRMDHDRICAVTFAAAFDMAEDAKPEMQSLVISYAKARLELLASHP
jgi:hypothetical protein